MKKVLQMFTVLLGIAAYSQGATCGSATPLTTPGTNIVVPPLTGTYVAVTGCPTGTPNPAPTASAWYSYTPTTNGYLTVTSNLTQNNGTTKSNETRLGMYSGTCAALTCVASSDDVSASNYLSTISNVPVTAGTTYYIQWDDGWGSTLGFDFQFTFSSCIPITASTLSVTNLTQTSFTLGWTAPTPAPASYDIEYGPQGFTQGTGTLTNTTSTSQVITGASGSNVSFYIRTNCTGGSSGAWQGPYTVYLVKSPPYTNNFDTTGNNSDGFTGTGWSLIGDNTTAVPPVIYSQSPAVSYYSPVSTTAANSQLYSRALNLVTGQDYTATFWSKTIPIPPATSTVPMNLKVYYNTSRSLTGATLLGSAIVVNSSTYIQQSRSFTVPANGTYYLIFSNETPATVATSATALFFDTFQLTSVLSTNEVSIDNSLAIYPNPVSDVLNIKTKGKLKSVAIYDLSGKRVSAELVNNSINVSSFQSGTYVIDIETSLGKSTQKFIKK